MPDVVHARNSEGLEASPAARLLLGFSVELFFAINENFREKEDALAPCCGEVGGDQATEHFPDRVHQRVVDNGVVIGRHIETAELVGDDIDWGVGTKESPEVLDVCSVCDDGVGEGPRLCSRLIFLVGFVEEREELGVCREESAVKMGGDIQSTGSNGGRCCLDDVDRARRQGFRETQACTAALCCFGEEGTRSMHVSQ